MSDQQQIIEAIAEHLGIPAQDVDRNALLREDLNLGPIELSDLLTNLSEKFQISFAGEDVTNLNKVEDLVILVEDSLLS